MRQVVLDTETTGLEVDRGHRIIEIGCVEILNRRLTGRSYHIYLNPERDIDEGAQEVHGISREMLADKPLFADVLEEFIEFVSGAELIIHNAEFDLGFLGRELELAGRLEPLADCCSVVDTLSLARQLHPGQRNSLDALCKRYQVDNSGRDLHGALLDAQLLAGVYLAMTGGQVTLSLDSEAGERPLAEAGMGRIERQGLRLVVRQASEAELRAHEDYLRLLDGSCPDGAVWHRLEG